MRRVDDPDVRHGVSSLCGRQTRGRLDLPGIRDSAEAASAWPKVAREYLSFLPLRDAVRSDSAAHPLVKAVRAGERGEGGDGVTVVELG
jgi:hypothetical protein